jgi:hypothetical protein
MEHVQRMRDNEIFKMFTEITHKRRKLGFQAEDGFSGV